MPSVIVSDIPGSPSLPLLATALLSLPLALVLGLVRGRCGLLRRLGVHRRQVLGRWRRRGLRRRRLGRRGVLGRAVPALRLAGARGVVADAVELAALVVLPHVDAAVLLGAALDAGQLLGVVV